MMKKTSTHFKVPGGVEDRGHCLGPDGAVAHVTRVIRMIQGRWKLDILFRLFADPAIRSSQLMRDMPGVSRKMLTQQLRELETDRLVERVDFDEKPLRVEYRLSGMGRDLIPVLVEARQFSASYADSPR